MKKLILIGTLIILLVTGCSTLPFLDSINPLKDDKGIEVSAQIGKNNTQNKTDNKSLVSASSNDKTEIKNDVKTDNKANTVNQTNNTSSDKSGISTKNTSSTTNDNKAETINQETSTITNYPIPAWLILAFALVSGIAIPNPMDILRNRRIRKERKENLDKLHQHMENLQEELRGKNTHIMELAEKLHQRSMAEVSKQHSNLVPADDDNSKRSGASFPGGATEFP